MAKQSGSIVRVFKTTFNDFRQDNCTQMAAALAYYTVFSLPALLVVVLMIAGAIFGAERVENTIQEQVSDLVGQTAADQLQVMRENADSSASGNTLKALIGIGTLIFGATGAFAHLQTSLNRIWEVEPDPEQGGIKRFVLKRFLSFGMILTVAFLLLAAMVVSAALTALGDWLAGPVDSAALRAAIQVANYAISFLVIAALFALMFKILPDAKSSWRDVAVGGAATAVLFLAGQALIGVYFRYADVGSAFGAAGSLALVLVWLYYSAVILFAGAELTQAYAREYGHGIAPEEGALEVIERKETRDAHGRRRRPTGRATSGR